MASSGRPPAASRNWICFSSRGSETIRRGELRRTLSPLPRGPLARAQGGQPPGAVLLQQRLEHAASIHVDAGGELGDRAGPPTASQVRGLDGRGDQVDQRVEVGFGCRPPCPPTGTAAAVADSAAADAIVADFGRGAERGVALAGLGLGQGDFRQPGVALLGVGRRLGQGDGGGEFARGNIRLDRRVPRLICRRCRRKAGLAGPESEGCRKQPLRARTNLCDMRVLPTVPVIGWTKRKSAPSFSRMGALFLISISPNWRRKARGNR